MDRAPLIDMRTDRIDGLRDRGYRLIADLNAAGLAVVAAGCVQTEDDGQLHLYLATPVAETGRDIDAYRTVRAVKQAKDVRRLRPTEVELIGPSSSLARGLMQAAGREPDADDACIVHGSDRIDGNSLVGRAFISLLSKPSTAVGG